MPRDLEQDGSSGLLGAAALFALVWVAWISDVVLAWLSGLRWGHWRFLLPSVGTFLGAACLAIVVAWLVPALRRRIFQVGVLLLILPGCLLLWVQRLAWRPADHHIGVAPWVAITVVLIIAPIVLARVRPTWLIAATPLLIFGYQLARVSGFSGSLAQIADQRLVAAVSLAIALVLATRLPMPPAVQRIGIVVSIVVAITGTALFIAWSNKAFTDETARTGSRIDARAGRGNIVLIVIDTLRADRLGAYGYRVRDTSPFLDRFASKATLFRNAYASTTWTVPSVATMFTGLPPELHGVTTYGWALSSRDSVMAEQLRRNGYHTIGISTNPLIDVEGGFARGFDRFVLLTRLLTATGSGGSLWSDAIITLQRGARDGWMPGAFAGWTVKPRAGDAVDEALERLDAAAGGAPVFLFVHLLDPHHPPSVLANDATKGWRITDADKRFDTAWSLGYDREIRYVDSQLERLIAGVDRRLDPQQTTIAIVADHGEQLGEESKRGHGLNLDEAVLRVPLIVRRPNEAGRVVDEAFSLNHLRELLVGQAAPRTSPLIRAHLIPPPEPDTVFRSVQLRRWKLIEITRAGSPSRIEQLLMLPDEKTNHASDSPQVAADLRLKLGDVPSNNTPAHYDAETAAKLRSLGYVK